MADTDWSGKKRVGINCAACHTIQIDYDGKTYQIDGDDRGVFARRFASDGTWVDSTIYVSDGESDDQTNPRVGFGVGGNFVVQWNDKIRWFSWNFAEDVLPYGPMIQGLSPSSFTSAPLNNIDVTFDWDINGASL